MNQHNSEKWQILGDNKTTINKHIEKNKNFEIPQIPHQQFYVLKQQIAGGGFRRIYVVVVFICFDSWIVVVVVVCMSLLCVVFPQYVSLFESKSESDDGKTNQKTQQTHNNTTNTNIDKTTTNTEIPRSPPPAILVKLIRIIGGGFLGI